MDYIAQRVNSAFEYLVRYGDRMDERHKAEKEGFQRIMKLMLETRRRVYIESWPATTQDADLLSVVESYVGGIW